MKRSKHKQERASIRSITGRGRWSSAPLGLPLEPGPNQEPAAIPLASLTGDGFVRYAKGRLLTYVDQEQSAVEDFGVRFDLSYRTCVKDSTGASTCGPVSTQRCANDLLDGCRTAAVADARRLLAESGIEARLIARERQRMISPELMTLIQGLESKAR